MNAIAWHARWTPAVLVFYLCLACTPAPTPSPPDGPATIALKRLVAEDPEVKRLLLASIDRARQVNPDPVTNPAQSLDQYYAFVAGAERAIPGSLKEQKQTTTLYQRIDQSLSYLFFICDQPLSELEGRGYFNNSLQYTEPYGAWLKTFVQSWGAFLDTPASWNDEYHRLALADESFGLSRGWYEAPTHWRTFNDFFTRRLKSPDQRPIASPTDPSVVISPVDAVPQGVWRIDRNSHLTDTSGVPIKSGTVRSVEQLLGADSRYRLAFAQGTFTHLFLDVGDYHHYHFPLGGTIREAAILPGREVVGGYIAWDTVNRRYAFDPSSVGWQSLETRGRLILETEEFGLVALLPIGMSPVSSVTLEPGLKEGAQVSKGDLMGHFRFGGSDFVMIFQRGYEFDLDPPPDPSTHQYSHRLMGQRLGRLRHGGSPPR